MSAILGHLESGEATPWESVTASQAREILGMSDSTKGFVAGALRSSDVRRYITTTEGGRFIDLFNRADVEALADRMGGVS